MSRRMPRERKSAPRRRGGDLKDIREYLREQTSDAHLGGIDPSMLSLTRAQRASLAIGPDADLSAGLSGSDEAYIMALIDAETKLWREKHPTKQMGSADHDEIAENVLIWLES